MAPKVTTVRKKHSPIDDRLFESEQQLDGVDVVRVPGGLDEEALVGVFAPEPGLLPLPELLFLLFGHFDYQLIRFLVRNLELGSAFSLKFAKTANHCVNVLHGDAFLTQN